MNPTVRTLVLGLFVYALAVFAYLCHGPYGTLFHDNALYLYAGQQMAAGTAPFVSLFDHKGPVGPMVCGLGVMLARLFEQDDVVGVRLLFLGLCSFSAVGIYALTWTLFQSRVQALFSALVFIAYRGYGEQAVSGPLPKTLCLLFVVFALASAARRRWFWAGACSALAALTWQPTGLYCLAVLVLAWFQGDRSGGRRQSLVRALLGIAVPTLAIGAYFLSKGALDELVDGILVFNLKYVERTGGPWRNLGFGLSALLNQSYGVGLALALGFVSSAFLYPWRARAAEARGLRFLVEDRFALFLWTYPFPLLWSLQDFQSYPDLYIFLPYASVGFGWLLYRGLEGILNELAAGRALRFAGTFAVAALMVACTLFLYRFRYPSDELGPQRAAMREIVADLGPDARIASIGAPELLVLLGRTNVTSYGFILRGVPNHIEDRFPGGFRGWLSSLEAADGILVNDVIRPQLRDDSRDVWDAWLAGMQGERRGSWTLLRPSRGG